MTEVQLTTTVTESVLLLSISMCSGRERNLRNSFHFHLYQFPQTNCCSVEYKQNLDLVTLLAERFLFYNEDKKKANQHK